MARLVSRSNDSRSRGKAASPGRFTEILTRLSFLSSARRTSRHTPHATRRDARSTCGSETDTRIPHCSPVTLGRGHAFTRLVSASRLRLCRLSGVLLPPSTIRCGTSGKPGKRRNGGTAQTQASRAPPLKFERCDTTNVFRRGGQANERSFLLRTAEMCKITLKLRSNQYVFLIISPILTSSIPNAECICNNKTSVLTSIFVLC